jgi:hypothetical protein
MVSLSDSLPLLVGPAGGFVLSVILLYGLYRVFMRAILPRIDATLEEHREDRKMYQETMLKLSESMHQCTSAIQSLQGEVTNVGLRVRDLEQAVDNIKQA